MIKRFNDYTNESSDYEKYQDFGCNYISDFIEKNPKYDNEDFFEYVSTYNKADRDSGELQDISKDEIERLAKEYNNKINEDAVTTASVGSGTAVSGGDSGSFVSAAGTSVSGGDSGSAFSTNSNTSGMGAIVSPQPSSIPGDVAGSTKGSGDISKGFGKANIYTKEGKKKKKKKEPTNIYNKKGAKIDKIFSDIIKKNENNILSFEKFNNLNK